LGITLEDLPLIARHKFKNKAIKITATVEKHIRKYLKFDCSLEQVAGKLKLDKVVSLTHEAIYQYIYKNKASGGRLYLNLPYKMKKYKNRSGSYSSRGMIIDRVPISKRPKIVEHKTRIGDFEIDTIIGKYHRGSIVSIVC
jgi:IS30 family transposase